MKNSTKNNIEGKLHETKGKAKEVAGIVVNDPVLETEGEMEQLAGKLQQQLGEIEKKLKKKH